MKELDSPNANNDLEQENETLVDGYSEAHLIHDHDTRIIQISPSEGFRPLGIFQDKLSGELNFLALFFRSNPLLMLTIDFHIKKLHSGSCCTSLVTFQHILQTYFFQKFI